AWWVALDPTPREPHGRSRYLGAPLEVWRQRRRLEDNERVWYEKFALGHGVLKAPSSYPPLPGAGRVADADGRPADPLSDGLHMLDRLRSGGVAVLPSERGAAGEPLWDYTPPTTTQDAGPLENRRRSLDAAALRSLGVPERAVTQDDATGSHAMAAVHWQVLQATCEGILSQIAASFQKYVVEKAVRLNEPALDGAKLTLVCQPIDAQRRGLVLQLVQSVLRSPKLSPLVAEGVVDVAKLLEIADLPTGSDLADRLRRLRSTPSVELPEAERRLALNRRRPKAGRRRYPAPDQSADVRPFHEILISCDTEAEQKALLEELIRRRLDVRALTV
ncbi:MAG: hypothetical protein ACRDD1_20370, partial [Planctomycetia bacterium]